MPARALRPRVAPGDAGRRPVAVGPLRRPFAVRRTAEGGERV